MLARALPRPALALTALAALALTGACATPKADVLVADGIRAQREGSLAVAEERYRKALELDPKARGAAHNLAVIALAKGDLDHAVPLLQQEIDAHGDAAEPRLLLATLALDRDKATEAEALAAPFADLSGGLPPTDPTALAIRERARLLVVVARRAQGKGLSDVRAGWPVEPSRLPTQGDGALAREAIAATALRVGDVTAAATFVAELDTPFAREVRAYAALAGVAPADDAVTDALRDDATAWAGLARVWAGESAADDAPADVAMASPDAGTAIAGARLKASVRATAGDWEGALAALSSRPGVAATRDGALATAIALAHVGRLDEARAALVDLQRQDPSDATVKTLLTTLSSGAP